MRAVGYSFETAVADLMDNCITAGATKIDLSFSAYGDPYIAILDDGLGLDAESLRIAMRHGSRNALLGRQSEDLGRFGLGLKTGSLSQCRCLTVVSKKDGNFVGARWDLDEIDKTKEWTLLELEEADFRGLPQIKKLEEMEQGTLIIWQKLDRVFEGEFQHDRALQNRIDDARAHLSLIYHRFLEKDSTRPLSIKFNNVPLDPIDPFLRRRKGGQSLPPENIEVEGQYVAVRAYILPHLSKLSAADIEAAGGLDGLRRNQGFYVYRNMRLIIWGTWFRLAKQEEMSKLARVIVDVPNTLDHLWKLDIKKSTAQPPEEVRRRLSEIVEKIADKSRRVYTHRGRTTTDGSSVHAWDRIELRGGKISYRINREHDLVRALRRSLPESQERLLERFMQSIEQLFPFDALYVDLASERRVAEPDADNDLEASLTDMAGLMLDALGKDSDEGQKFLERLHILDPFSKNRELTARIIEKLKCN